MLWREGYVGDLININQINSNIGDIFVVVLDLTRPVHICSLCFGKT
jgi:hypothetical protein